VRGEEDRRAAAELGAKLREAEEQLARLRQEQERVQALRGAYNADKKAF
jgi:hypothetical protein